MTESGERSQRGRVDPWEMLNDLSSLLGTEGNITGMEEVEEIARQMQNEMSEGKLVTTCTYLNTLRATTDISLLHRFVEVGGWSVLNDYLQQARDQDNMPLMLEILAVYHVLPVTVDLLKQNTAAKTIKQLVKSSPDTDVKERAQSIVDHWMRAVRGNSDKRKHHKDSKKSLSDSSSHENSKSSHKQHGRHKDGSSHKTSPKKAAERHSSCESNGGSPAYSDNHSDSSSTSNMRPKTVKTVPTKFRSAGLTETENTIPGQKKSNEKSGLKRPSQSKSGVQEKKVRISTDVSITSPSSTSKTSSPTEEKRESKIKLIPARPKPPPVKEVYESSGFMDALTPHTVAPLKIRKRKVSANVKDNERKSISQSTASVASSESTPRQEESASESRTELSTSPEEKKLVLPSFYKETLTTSEKDDDKSDDKDNSNDSSAQARSADDEEDNKSVQSSESYEPVKKKRKKVSWAEDADLRIFHFFELDETERVNVNRQNGNFADIQKKELMREKEMFQEARRFSNPPHSGDSMCETIAWRTPRRFTIEGETIKKGFNSKEKEVQRQREDGVLLALYFSKHMIPDSAAEPDVEVVSPQEPKIMPLDDETGQSGEVVFTEYPKPVTDKPADVKNVRSQPQLSLPPEVADLLASMAQQGQVFLNSSNQPQQFQGQPNHGQAPNFQGQPPPFQGQGQQFQGQNPQFQGQNQNFPGSSGPARNQTMELPELQQLINSLMSGQVSLESLSNDVKVQIQDLLTLQAQGAVPPPPSAALSGPQRAPLLPQPSRPDMNVPPPGFNRPMMGGPMSGPMGGPPPQFRGGGPPGMMRGRPPMRPSGPGPMRGGPPSRGDTPPLCRHFMAGACRFGPACRKLHPGINGPPLPGGPPGGIGRGGMSPPAHVSPQHA